MGHVIDLPSSQMGVDIEDHFKPKYITIRGKGDTLKKLKKEAKASQTVFLATDPDREGEAISYHLANALNIPLEKKCRVTFNEITKSTVQKSMKEPREIDLDLVNAQQARRVLDRIVGYQISPILWKKVKKGLSAGRVQSVATRLICDREDEINAFVPEEYWSLDAILAVGKRVKDQFVAKFYGENGKKEELSTKEQVDAIIADLKGATYTIVDVKEKEKIRRPMPPFTTSTLQQEASRKLNFATKKTMMIAQQLYEGIQIKGEGKIGLITYMRTDSLRISTEAQQDAKEYIKGVYGENYIPATPNVYKAKGASQDAHEAIRSTNVRFTPDEVKESLNNDQFKLYKLIWSRFVASQMANAVLDTVSVDIDGAAKKKKVYRFKSSGFTIKFNGYMAVYHDSDEEKEKALPKLTKDQQVEFENLQGDQHFTQPPARYTEATLVKTMSGQKNAYTASFQMIPVYKYEFAYIDAKKGDVLGYDLKPYDKVNTYINLDSLYPQLNGHYAKDIILKLFDMGIKAENKNFDPDALIPKSEFKNLAQSLNGSYHPYYDTISSKSDIEESSQPLTRMEAIKIIIDTLGYGKVASQADMFKCTFDDVADIASWDLGFATMAKGLGISVGTDNKLMPDKQITYAEAFIMIYRALNV